MMQHSWSTHVRGVPSSRGACRLTPRSLKPFFGGWVGGWVGCPAGCATLHRARCARFPLADVWSVLLTCASTSAVLLCRASLRGESSSSPRTGGHS
jgi:hypothetical protein